MKYVFYLSLLATALVQGASSSKAVFPISPDESLEPVSAPQHRNYYTLIQQTILGHVGTSAEMKSRCESILSDPHGYARIQGNIMHAIDEIMQGDLQTPVESLLKDLAAPAIKRIEWETVTYWTSTCKNGKTTQTKRERSLAETSFGKIYKKLATIGFSNELITLSPAARGKGIALFMENIFNPSTKAALEKTFTTTNEEQALASWREFARIFGGNILRKLNTSIPGIKLKPTVYETINANAHMELTPEQEIEYMAAQLAIAYSLSLQYKLDSRAFAKKAQRLREAIGAIEPTSAASYSCASRAPSEAIPADDIGYEIIFICGAPAIVEKPKSGSRASSCASRVTSDIDFAS